MSSHVPQQRLTTASIRQMKGQSKIACLTAYTTPTAKLIDPHCDLIVVGDSVGMVLYGMKNTVAVTLEMMSAHGCAVMRGVRNSCVIVDLPFGTYQESKEQAFRNALRLLQETGCDGIKLEGGEEMSETIAFLVARGIPVFGHVGLMPQMVNVAGSFRSLGHTESEADKIRRDAVSVAEAGAFAIVIEGTVEIVARQITGSIDIPTIGIGASPACDGQILVSDDMLGLFSDFTPKFVKKFADISPLISSAVEEYVSEVKAGLFPTKEHTFHPRRN
ncbi:3-methyl-2-oxobutanoate hydroxymethyltransferase [Ensifer adhaerens]|uniref:3-methyl-2-oxobutanoate hydroxymethyltransferase n=1 Tax=Ensifer adhaerens TaxID=106592 RepID=UPI001CC1130C|nr:3-methyl-2-oxobutanoate hydroxymethyltransferase [Ensifer adhaerens]MBZ7927755.1 3-methyl-2-oxobutanoate hydroxymethyltransferase [Ensifer adhaerens]UAX97599.1 3-methyl-2-oxobutanoate hydroxymethyltransferase [Ensifer adhaerens]UAY05010.1 3-methyl-2-oxobutanoate hydroxymethyltransferase [Ensifer adhaerens]UAY12430.1 3-methyl-2-oxobutanoate hydroxymethyltransferase [Ensifer adhaerens]